MIDAPVRSARIMVVEDSDDQAIELTSIMESNGYEVIRVSSAEAAMDMLKRDAPDLIIVDYQLTCIDGGELTRQLRLNERTGAVLIVLMTSDDRLGERAGLESGADVYVPNARSLASAHARRCASARPPLQPIRVLNFAAASC